MGTVFDISLTISEQLPVWPGEQEVKIVQTKFIDGQDGCNVSYFTMGMHAGTHVDVPIHFDKNGEDTSTIELEKFIGKAKVYEFDEDISINVEHLEKLDICEDDIILFKINKNNELLKQSKFSKDYVYISIEAARFLVDKKIKAVGINYFSVACFEPTDSLTSHHVFLENGVVIFEGLNLEKIETGEYQLYCLPLKFKGGNGSPARAVLIK